MMKNVETIEEAVLFCQENCLNVNFKKNEGEQTISYVLVSTTPTNQFKGNDLIQAVNVYIKGKQDELKQLDKVIVSDEERYEKDLYCNECGDDQNLFYQGNYAGWEAWECACGHRFQIKAKMEA